MGQAVAHPSPLKGVILIPSPVPRERDRGVRDDERDGPRLVPLDVAPVRRPCRTLDREPGVHMAALARAEGLGNRRSLIWAIRPVNRRINVRRSSTVVLRVGPGIRLL